MFSVTNRTRNFSFFALGAQPYNIVGSAVVFLPASHNADIITLARLGPEVRRRFEAIYYKGVRALQTSRSNWHDGQPRSALPSYNMY